MALTGVYTPNGFLVGNASAIDVRMGPFASADEATGSIITAKRYKGLTIITTGSNQTNEYWFKDGIANADLILKTSITSNTGFITTGSISTTQSITGSLTISGSTTNSGAIYFPNLVTSSATVNNVVMFGANGQLFVTASSVVGPTPISTDKFITTGSSSSNQTITGSLTISGSTINSGTIFLPNLITSSNNISNVVMFGANGQLFVTSSTAIGSTPISTIGLITTGSSSSNQTITGSLTISGSTINSGTIFLPNLVTSSTDVNNVVVFGQNGQLFITSSTAVGTAAISTTKFITTGSTNTTQSISGSINIFGNITAQSASFQYVSFQYVTASSILVNQNTITVRGNHDANILTAGYIAADSASIPYPSSSFLYNLGPGTTGYWTLDAPLSGSQFTGSLKGSSSYAISSSNTLSSSYANSSSYALSSSIANSASLVYTITTNINQNYSIPFIVSNSGIYQQLYVDSTNGMLYNPSTNLLIVTASIAQTASYALNVITASIPSYIATGSVSASVNVGANPAFKIVSASSDLITVNNTASNRLAIQGGMSTTGVGNTGRITLVDTQVGGATLTLDPQLGIGIASITSTGDLAFSPGSDEKARFTSTGNLLIGTTTNDGRLVVSGSTVLSGSLTTTGSVLFKGLTTSNESNFVTINTSTGQLYYTASSVLNANSVKAGSVANTSFSGNPSSSIVTLNPSYSNASYAISITGEDARIWTISSKAKDTFTINSNSTTALVGTTYWITTPYNN